MSHIYVIHYQTHTDCYKRADTSSSVLCAFKNPDDAYKKAIELFTSDEEFLNGIYKEYDMCSSEHIPDKEGICKACFTPLVEDENGVWIPDFTNPDIVFSREHVQYILDDESITNKDKYRFIHDNLYNIFGDGEFTMQPSNTLYFVTEVLLE